jgi:outer membrane protein OmpA-like peptidoglycan-associated protein
MKDYKLFNTPDKVSLPVKNTEDTPRLKKSLTPSPVRVQNKLMVNTPGDKHEQEADSMANKVTGSSTNASGLSTATSLPASEKEEGNGSNNLVNEVLQSGGRPLKNNTKGFMESRFGYDFSNVRIHDNSKAAQSAESINAKAYTHGSNIVFNKNVDYNSAGGQHLLAHELSHVVQQSGTGASSNMIQRQPLSPDKDAAMPPVDLRDSASPLLASALGSAEISRFKLGSAEIPKEGMDTLRYSAKQILFFLQKFSLSSVTIKGHTDKVGTDEKNVSLGQERADAVKAFLLQEGVPEAVMTTESKGENSPAVPTKDNVQEPRNRRVEVRFSVQKNPISFGMDLKLRPPEREITFAKPPEKPKINLGDITDPGPIGPVRDPDSTALWKKMEDGRKQIEEFDKNNPRKNTSVSDFIIDGVMDKAIKPLLKKLPLPEKIREKAEELIRDGIETGTEKAIDVAVDSLPEGLDKDAIKKAAKAALKQKTN